MTNIPSVAETEVNDIYSTWNRLAVNFELSTYDLRLITEPEVVETSERRALILDAVKSCLIREGITRDRIDKLASYLVYYESKPDEQFADSFGSFIGMIDAIITA